MGAKARADFHHHLAFLRMDGGYNGIDHIVVVQKILAEALTGGMAQMYLVVTHACLVTISMAWWRAVNRLPMSALPVPARSSAVP